VTSLWSDFDALPEDLEDAEDRDAVLEQDLELAKSDATSSLTAEKVDRLLTGPWASQARQPTVRTARPTHCFELHLWRDLARARSRRRARAAVVQQSPR
jgi:hypothetical protein